MKSVLISIQPKWCELIADGKKTIEVRKTKPKLETPFKVYIYCTKPRHYYKISKHLLTSDESLFLVNGKVRMCDGFGVEYEDSEYKHLNCKVIGEFVCDEILDCRDINMDNTCITVKEWLEYTKGHKGAVYAWHISDLKIYDKPRELGEFHRPCEDIKNCLNKNFRESGHCLDKCFDCGNRLARPPQSWCYVESEVTEE